MMIDVKMRGITKTGAMKNDTLVIRTTKVGIRKTGVMKTCITRTSEVPAEWTHNSHGVLPRAPHTVWNEAYIMLVSCIDYVLDMTCIQSVSQCFIVCGIL